MIGKKAERVETAKTSESGPIHTKPNDVMDRTMVDEKIIIVEFRPLYSFFLANFFVFSGYSGDECRSKVTSSGKAFFSSTTLGGHIYLKIVIGTPSTKAEHIGELWAAVQTAARDCFSQS